MKKKFKVRQFNFELRGANVTRKVGSQSVYGYYVLKQRKKGAHLKTHSYLLNYLRQCGKTWTQLVNSVQMLKFRS